MGKRKVQVRAEVTVLDDNGVRGETRTVTVSADTEGQAWDKLLDVSKGGDNEISNPRRVN